MTRIVASVAFAVPLAFVTAGPAVAKAPISESASGGAHYETLPATADSWYWEIDPPRAGLSGLPATSAAYPAPGSANIWDTDLFYDSNTSSGSTLGVPTGASPVVQAIHSAGHYSVCYVEAGAYQTGFPDDSDFAAADYGNAAKSYQMQGYSNEWWLNIAGFENYVAGDSSTLTGAAVNIAAALNQRFNWCSLEGQDAVEPDDLDGYTNKSATGAKGGGWGLTQADSAGFERWIAYEVHADGLAVLQKNDPANEKADEPLFDGVLTEECNYYDDPCAGKGGDWDAYLAAGKPVLNAEYKQDGETTSKFCPADDKRGIWGALFSVNLNGPRSYKVCWTSQDLL
jgi:hypothetical protein